MESEPPCDTYIQHKSETKNTRPLKFKRLPKSLTICKNIFQGDQRNFSSSREVKIFFESWKKVTNDSTILSIVKVYSIDFLETSYQPITPIMAKLNQVQQELVSHEVKKCLLQNLGFVINLKKSVFSPNSENRILGYDNKLGGDGSVPASGEGRVNFQKVSRYIVNAGGVNKRPSKAFGNVIIKSISNSSCTTVFEAPAEATNSQPLFEKRLQQKSSYLFIISCQVELLIQSDASKTGWGTFCQKKSIGGGWSQA